MSESCSLIEVYVNPHGDIVIRQTQASNGEQNTIIVEPACVPHLIDQLAQEAARAQA